MNEQQLWKYFGGKYILSTPLSRRQESIKSNFNAIGMTDYEIIEFEPSAKYKKSGQNDSGGVNGIKNQSLLSTAMHKICDDTAQNIAQNMFALARKGYDDGHETIMIFEDDARFSVPFNYKKLARTIKWMMTHEWDIFYWGYCQWPKLVSWVSARGVVKLTSPLCLHGYCLSRTGMEKALKMQKYYNLAPQHIDKLYGHHKWRKYGAFPSICFQADPPALYKKAIEKLPIDIEFKLMSQFMEYSSIVVPFLLCAVIFMIILHFMKNDLKK